MRKLVDQLVHKRFEPADVEFFELLDAVSGGVAEHFDGVDVLVHSLLDFYDSLGQFAIFDRERIDLVLLLFELLYFIVDDVLVVLD